MKNLIFIILFAFSAISGFSQVEKKIMNQLKANDYSALTELMDSRLDLCIKENQEFMPKSEALSRIKTYNESNPVSTWKLIHGGNSKTNTSKYSIIEVATSSDPYRLMLYFTGDMITEIRFE